MQAEPILLMLVTGNQRPRLYLNPWDFSMVFCPLVSMRRAVKCGWVGAWNWAQVVPHLPAWHCSISHRDYSRKLNFETCVFLCPNLIVQSKSHPALSKYESSLSAVLIMYNLCHYLFLLVLPLSGGIKPSSGNEVTNWWTALNTFCLILLFSFLQ